MAGLRKLIAIEGFALSALLLAAAAVGAFGAIDALLHPGSIFTPRGMAILGFSYTLVIGAPVVLLFGAPAYWLLARRGRASAWAALLLGVAPGCLMLFWDPGFAAYAIVCGAFAALSTHWASRRWLRAMEAVSA